MLYLKTIGVKELANSFIHQSVVYSLIILLVTGTGNVFEGSLTVYLLNNNVKRTPDLPIVTFPKRVELIVIGPSLCIDFGLLVLPENSSHGPFAVNKAAVLN